MEAKLETPEQIRDFVKEIAGEARAEVMKEADALVASLKEQFGSVNAAKAAGQETDIFVRSGHEDAKRPAAASQGKISIGQYVRFLAQNGGNSQVAAKAARDAGKTDLANLFDKAVEEKRQKAMLYSDFGSGGALVPEDFANDVIGLLYPAESIMGMGVQILPMPNGALTLPFLDTGVTAYYVGETANITPSEQDTGQMQLVAKKLAAVCPVSNDLLRTPSARADQFVQRDLTQRFRARMESAFLNDDGASGKPKGLKNWVISGNTFNQGGTALANKVSDLGKCIRLVQDQNVPILSGGFVLSHRTEWGLKLTLDSLGNFVFLNQMEAGSLMGFQYRATTNVPDNLSGSQSYVLFGSFGHVVVGDTEMLEITVHPDGAYYNGSAVVSGISQDTTPIRGIARHDLGCQYRGKELALIEQVTWA